MIIERVRSYLASFFQRKIIQNTLTILKSFVLRILFQAVYFIILARTFGSEKYGSYVAIIALISIFIPFASWGSGEVLIQNVSNNPTLFKKYFGTAILKTIAFGTLFILIISAIHVISPLPNISYSVVFFLSLANLIFLKLSDLCKEAFTAVGIYKYVGRIIIFLSMNRFFASLLLLFLFKVKTLLIWSILYCLATLITALLGFILVIKVIGYPQIIFSSFFNDFRKGFSFSIGTSAQNIYNDLDKSMLGKLSTAESAGIYGAAYQILNVALAPVQSLALASFRDFFRKGSTGIRGSFNFCKRLIPLSFNYSLAIMLGLLIFAPFLPKIIGDQYSNSTIALMWLAPTILFKAFQILAANILTGANYQILRSTNQVLIAILNALLNFWLIPLYNWKGAILATLISELLLMISLWGSVYILSKKTK